MITALVGAIAIYSTLIMVTAQTRHARFYQQRASAILAAEAGLAWAMARLRDDPAYCGTPDPAPINGMSVDVSISNCTVDAPKQIQAHVQY